MGSDDTRAAAIAAVDQFDRSIAYGMLVNHQPEARLWRKLIRPLAISALDGDGDAKLRELREWLHREWLGCIEAKKHYDVNTRERHEMQAEANAIQRACFEIDRLLAQPAPEAPDPGNPPGSPDGSAEARIEVCDKAAGGTCGFEEALREAMEKCNDLAARAEKAEKQRDAALAAQNARAVEELGALRQTMQRWKDAVDALTPGAGGRSAAVADVVESIERRIAALRTAQPAEPAPAQVPAFEGDPRDCAFRREGDEVLREMLAAPLPDLIGQEDAQRFYRLMVLTLKALASRALGGAS